ncbi:MAG: hypothetical protein ABI921_07715 [Panacibacter sp.]
MNKLKSAQIRLFFFTPLILFNVTASKAPGDSLPPLRIAVLAPLYLDSAFENHIYKLGNTSIPKLFLPGLDFYNGVTMAVDSLQKEGVDLDVWIYDTKKKGQLPDTLAAEMASMNFSLVLASFSNTAEQKVFSAFSFNNNIPLVSATYPNDAYVTGNPYFLMVNTSLRTHAEAIYKYAQRNYPIGKFLYVTRKGSMEDKIQSMFTESGKKTYPLNYKTVQMPDNFTVLQLLPLLDSNRQNIVICGSLDEKFGTNLIKVLDQSTSYQTVAIGMPTWDGLKAASNTASETLEIVYSTPYIYPRTDKNIADITALHKTKFNGRPSDMVFKGFETMYCFSKLLLKYHNDLLNNLSDGTFRISQNFQFQPAKLNNDAQVPDYIENKKLFFIHVQQGTIKSVE